MPSDRNGTIHQTEEYGDILIEQEMDEINNMENLDQDQNEDKSAQTFGNKETGDSLDLDVKIKKGTHQKRRKS